MNSIQFFIFPQDFPSIDPLVCPCVAALPWLAAKSEIWVHSGFDKQAARWL